MKKTYKVTFFLFILIEIFVYIVSNLYVEQKRVSYIKDLEKDFKKDFNFVNKSFNNRADIIYENIIDTDSVKRIFKNSHNPKTKDESRQELFEELKKPYDNLKSENVKQLHFHLPNNESFLRFHRPNRYGDNLSDVRKTVAYVNEYKKQIKGFEEGSIYNGFRNVYPLTLDGEHLGSVEISAPSFLIEDFIDDEVIDALILVRSDIVDEKIFKDEKKNYTTSCFGDTLKVAEYHQSEHTFHEVIPKNLKDKISKNIAKDMKNKSQFSYYVINSHTAYVVTFLALVNPVTNEEVGLVALALNSEYLYETKFDKVLLFILLTIINVLAFVYYIRHKIDLESLRDSVKELEIEKLKLSNTLDFVDNSIFTTDLKRIIFANRAFLEFFKKDSIEDFKKYHDCICDYFVEKDGFFSETNIKGEKHWILKILQLPSHKQLIAMYDANHNVESFSVHIRQYGDIYFIAFSKITRLANERDVYKQKASYDALTKIYNRDMFEYYLKKEYERSIIGEYTVSLIMFDIDHFKSVNDNYGHDVGDIVLTHLSKVVSKHLRQSDVFARWGGEEFMILMPHCTSAIAYKKAEDIRSIIEHME
jgi:GGDEF domain-containing protein